MSDPRLVLLLGATGLIGSRVMEASFEQPWLRLVALSRREAPMPRGGQMQMLLADPAEWHEAITGVAPDAVICALGTTMRKAGGEDEFRAVDHDLVLAAATAAREAGVQNFVLVSSVGASSTGKSFYLRVKAEVEAAVTKLKFRRLDILRPGLLRGARVDDLRPLERMAVIASPVAELFMRGEKARYRSIDSEIVAAAAIQCAREKAQGRFVHEHDSIVRAARRLEGRA